MGSNDPHIIGLVVGIFMELIGSNDPNIIGLIIGICVEYRVK